MHYNYFTKSVDWQNSDPGQHRVVSRKVFLSGEHQLEDKEMRTQAQLACPMDDVETRVRESAQKLLRSSR